MFRSHNGRYLTKKIFIELCTDEDLDKWKPMFSMNEEDNEKGGKVYPSMYRLYMDSVDEHDFVMTHIGSIAMWERLLKSGWFYDGYRNHRGIEKWREDMAARDRSLAKKVLMSAIKTGNTTAAKKFLDEYKPEQKTETKRGRFVKEEAIKEAAAKSEDKEFLDSAVKRLNVVNIKERF